MPRAIAVHYAPEYRELWFDVFHAYAPEQFYEIGTPEDLRDPKWLHVDSVDDLPGDVVLFQPTDAHCVPGTVSIFDATPEQLDGIWLFGPDEGYIKDWRGGDVIFVPSKRNMYSFQAAAVALAVHYGDH